MIKETNREEFEQFLKSIDAKKIGTGTEATCYLGNDGYCYKLYSDELINSKNSSIRKKVNQIITTSEIKSDVFIFPEELYVENGTLLAHKTKYIEKNIFGKENMNDSILHLKEQQIVTAYLNMVKDIVDISKKGILLVDAVGDNLLYDGEKMYYIDTCEYEKVNQDENELFLENKKRFDSCIQNIFNSYYKLEDEGTIENIEEYVKKIKEASINYGLDSELKQTNTEQNRQMLSFASNNLSGYLDNLFAASANKKK